MGARAWPHGAPRRVAAMLADTYQFVRFAAIGFSLLVPLLGAATSSRAPTVETLLGIVLVTIAFHCYAYVLNDVVDLPLDRTEPLRAVDPLVRGTVSARTAVVFAVAQLPVAFGFALALDPSPLALGALACAFGGMTVYDLWGKRATFPPLTDAVQGVGWGALAVYGTAATGGTATRATIALVAALVVYILLVNGVHGSLRDLPSDLRGGARTTAILFGARPADGEHLLVAPGLWRYALLLQGTLLAIGAVPLAGPWPPHAMLRRATACVLYAALGVASVALLVRASRVAADRCALIVAGLTHLVLALGTLALPFAVGLAPSALVLAGTAYGVPVAAYFARNGMRGV